MPYLAHLSKTVFLGEKISGEWIRKGSAGSLHTNGIHEAVERCTAAGVAFRCEDPR